MGAYELVFKVWLQKQVKILKYELWCWYDPILDFFLPLELLQDECNVLAFLWLIVWKINPAWSITTTKYVLHVFGVIPWKLTRKLSLFTLWFYRWNCYKQSVKLWRISNGGNRSKKGSYQHHSAYFKIFPCVWSHTMKTNSEAPTFYALIPSVGL